MAIQDLAGNYGLLPDYVDLPQPALGLRPPSGAPAGLQMSAAPAEAPAAPAPRPMISPETGRVDLQSLLARYEPGESSYANELKQARGAAARETQAFNALLQRAMEQQDQTGPSKAEMYFRLAAAFGTPTKTGNFFENLGEAGKAGGEMMREERAAERANRQLKLSLGVEAGKAKMTAAKEDLNTIRTLAAEEMKDKRAVATKLLEQYIKSGEPESAAGKQAKDEGFKVGTPEYQKRVSEIGNMLVEKQMAQINATLAGTQAALGNLAVAQARLGMSQDAAKKLTPGEVKLKTETEDLVASADSALGALKRAYSLNPNTFDNSVPDTVQRKALEAAGSKNPKVIATREMETLLGEQALAKLRAAFGGNPTEGERKILLDLQGIGAKSREERAAIMRNAYSALQTAKSRQVRRLNEINAGLYRDTQSSGGIE